MAEPIKIDKRFLCKGSEFCFPLGAILNNSLFTANNVTVTFDLPSGIEYSSSNLQGKGSYNTNTNVWTIPTLASGQMAFSDFCWIVTNDCLAPFKFVITVGSTDVCFVSSNQKTECYVIEALTCCDTDNCDYEEQIEISSSYAVQLTNRYIKVNASTKAITIIMPEPSDAYNTAKGGGLAFHFRISDLTNPVKIITPSGKIVDMSLEADASDEFNFSLVGQRLTLVSNGTNYDVYNSL